MSKSDINSKINISYIIVSLVGIVAHVVNILVCLAGPMSNISHYDKRTSVNVVKKETLCVGDRVIVQCVGPCGLYVRPHPNKEEQYEDEVRIFDGNTGVITKTKPCKTEEVDHRYKWLYIKWDNGKRGWSAIADIDGDVWITHETQTCTKADDS